MTDIQINTEIDSITMPENLRISQMVREHREHCDNPSHNFDYYNFAFGQSPFHIPPPITEALKRSADNGNYTVSDGIMDLRKAISGFNKRHFGLDIDPDRIMVGPGTKQLIYLALEIISGDVIIPSPSWIGYLPQVKILKKPYHIYHMKPEHGYRIDPEGLEIFLSTLPKTQHMLILNNPHNPTGAVYTKDELKKITEICRNNNTLILSDEIYALTTYDIKKFTSLGKIYPEGTFITNGLSKDRSAGGYRLGTCIFPENDTEKMKNAFKKTAATIYTNVAAPIQHAAITAYEPSKEIEEYMKTTREIHRIMGAYTSAEFNKIHGLKATTPQGAFYFYLDFNDLKDDLKRKGIKTSNELMHSLISDPHHIATVTGDACMIDPDNYGARIAFVDYDGKKTYDNYLKDRPKTRSDEQHFAKENAPLMVKGIEALRNYVRYIRA